MDWKDLDALIKDLEGRVGVDDSLIPFYPDHAWSEIWRLVHEIYDGFRAVRYPSLRKRQDAWEHFQDVRRDASRKSSAQREARKARSEWLRSHICEQARLARPVGGIWEVVDPTTADEMRTLGRLLNEASAMLTEHKEEMLGSHKQECFETIRDSRAAQQEWWDARNRHVARRKKANLAKNEARLETALEALGKMEASADRLRDMIATAWNEDWAAQKAEALSELEEKIEDTKRHIRRLEEWIEQDSE